MAGSGTPSILRACGRLRGGSRVRVARKRRPDRRATAENSPPSDFATQQQRAERQQSHAGRLGRTDDRPFLIAVVGGKRRTEVRVQVDEIIARSAGERG